MTPDEYQKLAMTTRCSQSNPLDRLSVQPHGCEMLHAVIGLTGEVGELASAIEKFAYYKQDLDKGNLIEEIGDCLWYLAELCESLNITLESAMLGNIAKLKSRYPNKFNYEDAREENRDRTKEKKEYDPTDPQDLYRFITNRNINRVLAEDDGPRYEN